MGGKVAGFFTLALIGVIIADVLANPKGVAAFGTQANNVLKSTYRAMLGKA